MQINHKPRQQTPQNAMGKLHRLKGGITLCLKKYIINVLSAVECSLNQNGKKSKANSDAQAAAQNSPKSRDRP
jgi:hypothetical protein